MEYGRIYSCYFSYHSFSYEMFKSFCEDSLLMGTYLNHKLDQLYHHQTTFLVVAYAQ